MCACVAAISMRCEIVRRSVDFISGLLPSGKSCINSIGLYILLFSCTKANDVHIGTQFSHTPPPMPYNNTHSLTSRYYLFCCSSLQLHTPSFVKDGGLVIGNVRPIRSVTIWWHLPFGWSNNVNGTTREVEISPFDVHFSLFYFCSVDKCRIPEARIMVQHQQK